MLTKMIWAMFENARITQEEGQGMFRISAGRWDGSGRRT